MTRQNELADSVRRALERVRRTAADEPDALCRLRALSRGQDGQFATAQARILGLKQSALVWLRDRRETERLARGVWRFRTAPGQADPAVTAFLLCWPHAVISHASAARHHGLRRVPEPPRPEVMMPLTRRRAPAGVTVHVTRNLPGCDIVECGSVYYTSLARTVCELADPSQASASLAVLDDAVALGANPRWINQRATALAAGRGAVRLVRDATAAGAAQVFRSWLERTSAHVYRCATLPDPDPAAPVRLWVDRVFTIAGAERGFTDGTAEQSRFAEPSGIAVDGSGELVVADTVNSLVRFVSPALALDGNPSAVTTLAGTGERGLTDGAGNVARFFTPRGIAEKALLTYEFMDYSLHLYGEVRQHLRAALRECAAAGKRVAIFGSGEAAELAYLSLKESGLDPVAVFDSEGGGVFLGMPVMPIADQGTVEFDLIIVATLDRSGQPLQALLDVGVPTDKLFPLRKETASPKRKKSAKDRNGSHQ